jgi:hypothetical protein
MNIQWTYNDFRTKGPIIRNVLSWEIADAVNLNRGTYRDTWPMLPSMLGYPKSSSDGSFSGMTMPDDGVETPTVANSLDSDFPQTGVQNEVLWTGTRVGKIRVPDEIMHIAPRTRYEEVVYLKFYDGAFVTSTTPTTLLTGVTSNNTTNVVSKTAHGFVTGDMLKFISGTDWATLVAATIYYVIKIDANTFYLATSLVNAYAATAIDLTGTNGTAGIFLGMKSAEVVSGDVVGFVQLSEIVSWNVV